MILQVFLINTNYIKKDLEVFLRLQKMAIFSALVFFWNTKCST